MGDTRYLPKSCRTSQLAERRGMHIWWDATEVVRDLGTIVGRRTPVPKLEEWRQRVPDVGTSVGDYKYGVFLSNLAARSQGHQHRSARLDSVSLTRRIRRPPPPLTVGRVAAMRRFVKLKDVYSMFCLASLDWM